MRKLVVKSLIISAGIFLSFNLSFCQKKLMAYIKSAKGAVAVSLDNGEAWRKAPIKKILRASYRIKTEPNSMAVLKFSDGSIYTLERSIDKSIKALHAEAELSQIMSGIVGKNKTTSQKEAKHFKLIQVASTKGNEINGIEDKVAIEQGMMQSGMATNYKMKHIADVIQSIAVVDFKPIHLPKKLGYLTKGIPNLLINDLSDIPSLRIIERQDLQSITDEWVLMQSGFADSKKLDELGQLVSADYLLTGAIMISGSQISIQTRLVSVTSGEIVSAQEAQGSVGNQIFELADQLAAQLKQSLAEGAIAEHSASGGVGIDLAFIIDSTVSMEDEIDVINTKIKEIVDKIRQGKPMPKLRLAIVEYKDRNDVFTTKVYPFTTYATKVMDYVENIEAAGGGDYPEALVQAIHVALNQLQWNMEPRTKRMIFVVTDAPPHLDYNDRIDYEQDLKLAAGKNISIHALACSGLDEDGVSFLQKISRNTNGTFKNLTYKRTFKDADGSVKEYIYEGNKVYALTSTLRSSEWKEGVKAAEVNGLEERANENPIVTPSAFDIDETIENNLDEVIFGQIVDEAKTLGVKFTKASGSQK